MNVKELIINYAKESGNNWLYNAKRECGCFVDEFHHCENICGDCEFGHVIERRTCEEE